MKNEQLIKYSNPKEVFNTFKSLLKRFKGRYLKLIIVIILVIFTSFTQIYGTYMLKDIIHFGIELKDYNYLIRYTSILGLIYLIGSISAFIYNTLMINISQSVVYSYRNALYNKVLSLPLSYFDNHQNGQILSYFTNDIDSMINALNQALSNIIFSIFNIIGTLIGMFAINIYLALIASIIIIITAFFIIFNSKKSRKYYKKQQASLSELNKVIEEDLRGIKVIKAFLHDEKSFINFEMKNKEWKNDTTSAFFHNQLNTPFIVSLSYLNFAISTIVGLIFIKNGYLEGGIGALTPFIIYVRQSGQPFNMFTVHLNNILTMLAGVERIEKFLKEDEENLKDKGKIILFKENDKYYWKYPNNNKIPLEGNIIFNNVSFGYNSKVLILKNISFYAKKGQSIAFVGSTGAGKTTIISLINRFYDIKEGSITYDGISIYDIKLESLRRAMNVVSQDTHLFSDTIYNNIRYPRLHSTYEEVINASKIGGSYNFINNLKDKYETFLYDAGMNLSAGERQLLSLSRVSITKPPLLILDEATSNIDTRTERIVQSTFNKLMENRTVLVIAHRLSTVRNSTAIIVLEKGKVIERGNHEDLLKLKGHYYSLYKGIIELS